MRRRSRGRSRRGRLARPAADGQLEGCRPTSQPRAGSWGPTAASDLIERDGRRWFELLNEDFLKHVDFKDGDHLFRRRSSSRSPDGRPGETIIRKGDIGRHMHVLVRGEAEGLDENGKVLGT